MVIAQIVESDTLGGTERLVIQIALELRRRGHLPFVMGPPDGAGHGWLRIELQSLGFSWTTMPRRWMLDPRAVSHIVSFIRRNAIDAVHSHEFAPSVYGAAATWLTRKPHVMTMHSNPYYAGAWRRRAAFRWAARHSAVVAVSNDTRDNAESVLGLRPGSVQVIPNGIVSHPGQRDVVRKELGLADDEMLIIALGNVSPRKAHSIILNALIGIRERRPELRWRFAIAGTDQGCVTELRERAQAANVESQFHLLGHRSDTENLLAAADIFAMSSLHEGMPLAIMEAMFAGKAVVTSTAGGIGEMITDGVEGLLIPVGNVDAMAAGLERLMSDGGLRSRLGAAARIRAERQFGIGPMMDAYLELYQRGSDRA